MVISQLFDSVEEPGRAGAGDLLIHPDKIGLIVVITFVSNAGKLVELLVDQLVS